MDFNSKKYPCDINKKKLQFFTFRKVKYMYTSSCLKHIEIKSYIAEFDCKKIYKD